VIACIVFNCVLSVFNKEYDDDDDDDDDEITPTDHITDTDLPLYSTSYRTLSLTALLSSCNVISVL